MSGKLYGVGVGPGDPEMMTLKAIKTIKEADVICLPNADPHKCRAYTIAASVIPELSEKETLSLDFKMTKDIAHLKKIHREYYHKCKDYLLMGKNVTFLTIGDPTIYSTYGYIMELAQKDGIETMIINGVTSFCGSAASAKTMLSMLDENIHILSGQSDIDQFLKLSGTKIIMKYGKNISKIKEKLIDMENNQCAKVYAIADCGMKTEEVFLGAAEIPEVTTYMMTIIVKD